jgi:hypothetical protein
MLPTLWAQLCAEEIPSCANKSCGRRIAKGDECFADSLGGEYYCKQCGIMLRYHRKKADQRGDPLPVAFEDVGKRRES